MSHLFSLLLALDFRFLKASGEGCFSWLQSAAITCLKAFDGISIAASFAKRSASIPIL
jgi:hypothetical protein